MFGTAIKVMFRVPAYCIGVSGLVPALLPIPAVCLCTPRRQQGMSHALAVEGIEDRKFLTQRERKWDENLHTYAHTHTHTEAHTYVYTNTYV